MSSRNHINLDTIKTKVPSEPYKSNWDRIFGQPKDAPTDTPETNQKATQNAQPSDLS